MRKPGNPHRQKKGRTRAYTLAELWHMRGGRCKYCGCMTDLDIAGPTQATRDHVLPRAMGGKQSGNLVLACRLCNETKAATVPVHLRNSTAKR